MAPWSDRLLTPTSRPDPGQNSPGQSKTLPAQAKVPSRVTEENLLEHAYGIPTLSHGTALSHPSSKARRTASHGRSMSHPFPSLFTGRKKVQGDSGAGFESTDEDSISPTLTRNTSLNPSAKQIRVPDRDLMTGKCMTCGSMVRWPKDLKVFRCTVCLTINDLKPIFLGARSGDGHRAVKHGPQKATPLSVEKTKQLLDQCITEYLLDRLKHDEGDDSGTLSQSPLEERSLEGRNIPTGLYAEKMGVRQSPSNVSPIHYSGLQDSNADGKASSNHKVPKDFRGQQHSIPYSSSSPGSFLGAHMEQEKRQTYSLGSSSPSGVHQDNFLTMQGSTDTVEIVQEQQKGTNGAKNIFKPLEEYIITSFGSFESINNSFSTLRPIMASRTASENGNRKRNMIALARERHTGTDETISEMDAKTLLLGDFAENGSWWTGGRAESRSPQRSRIHLQGDCLSDSSVTLKSPRIDWVGAKEWFHIVLNAGGSWQHKLADLTASELQAPRFQGISERKMDEIEHQIMAAQDHTQRVLLKATESLLKRPGRPLLEPNDIRFLLILLANPLLYASDSCSITTEQSRSRSRSRDGIAAHKPDVHELSKKNMQSQASFLVNTSKGSSGKHSGIIKRILGLLSNVPNECHHHLVSWFARYSDSHFQRTTDLIGSFVTYRLTRQHGKTRESSHDPTTELIPNMGSGRATSAALHAALGVSGQSSKKTEGKPKPVIYNDDWQIKAAAKVMALIFAANNSGLTKRGDMRTSITSEAGHSVGLAARQRAHNHGQILPTSDFYNTLLDYSDLVADFEAWEGRRGKFAFCQYPFFLSIWAKIQIMEHDARRQMEVKAREAFFDSIMTHKNVNQYLVLKIRRECLVEDSLKGVSEVVGSGGEEIKKGLRIEFKGEEGIDAGGLRKEWFLLLVRDVFNPDHGMFTYDEDSHFCYFNPNSFETTDQFFLVGVVLGLAIYNSTILDVALPPFAFRKLLAAGPAAAPGATSHAKPSMTYTLEDLAEYRPALASGLRQLLEFEGDVENTFCRDFVADVERYGQTIQVPLCPNGEKKPVTSTNRREFVNLYVRYLLDVAVSRQFEPFKRGFFTVCGGNALSLFRPEEIELLIRGSDEPLDIASLRAVSICENWGMLNAAETEPVVQWFWQSFQSANPKDQRKLLSFITGSDRIPAMGATNLVVKLSCLGEDSSRFPVARTCFNMLSLWRYSSSQKLEMLLWRAVHESEGFGLK